MVIHIVNLLIAIILTIVPYILKVKCNLIDIPPTWPSQARLPPAAMQTITAIVYFLLGTSFYFTLNFKPKTKLVWLAIAMTLLAYALDYAQSIIAGCQGNYVTGIQINIFFFIALLTQFLIVFQVDATSGLLIAPALGWYMYTLILNMLYLNSTTTL